MFKCCKLKVNSNGAVNGIFLDKYGSRGTQKIKNMPSLSIPIEWSKGPLGTVSYAITLLDYDSFPVVGFPWVHWTICNIPSDVTVLSENSSRNMPILIEGVTSFSEDFIVSLSDIADFRVSHKNATGYGGFAPSDKPHSYTIKVFALSSCLNLNRGFFYNDLFKAMKGKVLGVGSFEAVYNNK